MSDEEYERMHDDSMEKLWNAALERAATVIESRIICTGKEAAKEIRKLKEGYSE
jgi:hypothetical protein